MATQAKTAKNSSRANGSARNLRERFHDYLTNKIAAWVLREHVDEGNPSWLKWDAEDKQILEQVLRDPKAADLELSASDSKFRKFFQSVIQNGFNTGDVQMFYRYRDQLPLRQLHWSFDQRDFDTDDTLMRSTVKLPASFYMVEIQIRLSRFSSRVPLLIHRSNVRRNHRPVLDADMNQHAKSGDDFAMNLVSHRVSKRLIWLKEDGYLDLVTAKPDIWQAVSHLRLARTTRVFFIDRMMRRMGQVFDASRHSKMNDEQLERLWQRYDQYFVLDSHAVPSVGDRHWSGLQGSASQASRDRQISDLTEWLKKNYR